MPILKLTPATPFTFTVQQARVVQGQFGEQVAFDDGEGNTLFMSETAALRQLERLGLDVQTVAGETLTFSKVQKGEKSFNNIDRAGGAPLPKSVGRPTTKQPVSMGAPGFLEDQDDAEAQFLASVRDEQPVAKPTTAGEAGWNALFAHYDKCLEFILTVEAPKLRKAGVEVTHEGLSAQTATLLIAARDRRLAA